jgi:hypothetical protein
MRKLYDYDTPHAVPETSTASGFRDEVDEGECPGLQVLVEVLRMWYTNSFRVQAFKKEESKGFCHR